MPSSPIAEQLAGELASGERRLPFGFVASLATGVSVAGSPESHEIFLGNFSDGLVGFRMNPSVRILDGTTSYASNLLIEVVAAMRIDFVALRPASFVTLEGVTTS